MFIDRLIEEIQNKKSSIVVGLDPRLDRIPRRIKNSCFAEHGKTLKAVGEAILNFNKGIIDAVSDIVPAVKPQIAFYEQYGLEGLYAYIETCRYACKKGLLVIGDAKRGDIGTTSQAYSNAHLGSVDIEGVSYETFAVDAVTTNPYLGDDCLKEFVTDIQKRGKGMFVLVKTSNPTSGQLQDLMTDNRKIYEIVAEMVQNWSQKTLGKYGYGSVGAVVGATYPRESKILRKVMPNAYFLVPGYGAQGARAEDIVDCFDENGLGALVNSSRGIIFAYLQSEKGYTEEKFREAARSEALKMKDEINQALEKRGKLY